MPHKSYHHKLELQKTPSKHDVRRLNNLILWCLAPLNQVICFYPVLKELSEKIKGKEQLAAYSFPYMYCLTNLSKFQDSWLLLLQWSLNLSLNYLFPYHLRLAEE